MKRPKLVYLTGAPASGKSTLLRALARSRVDVEVFEYGKEMVSKLNSRGVRERLISQEDLRGGTDGRVTQAEIDELDAELGTWVDRRRGQKHLIVDSHHVTLEAFGFRVAPFSPAKLAALRLDELWLLVLDEDATLRRIRPDPKGRRMPSSFQANFHTHIQASLASQYAALSGCPLYIFDSSICQSDLLAAVSNRLP